jgi:hypothetical protein
MRFFRSNLRPKALFSKTPAKNHKKIAFFHKKTTFLQIFLQKIFYVTGYAAFLRFSLRQPLSEPELARIYGIFRIIRENEGRWFRRAN